MCPFYILWEPPMMFLNSEQIDEWASGRRPKNRFPPAKRQIRRCDQFLSRTSLVRDQDQHYKKFSYSVWYDFLFEGLNFFPQSLFRIKHKSLEARVNFRSNNMFCAVLHLITFLQNTRRNSRNNCSNMLLWNVSCPRSEPCPYEVSNAERHIR